MPLDTHRLDSQGDEGDGAEPPQKKQKVPNPNRQVSRITRACDHCRTKKMRCTGAQPCVHCIQIKINCTYDKAYNRGARAPPKVIPPEKQAEYLAQYGWPVGEMRRHSNKAIEVQSNDGFSGPGAERGRRNDEHVNLTSTSGPIRSSTQDYLPLNPFARTETSTPSNSDSHQRNGANASGPSKEQMLFDRTQIDLNQRTIPSLNSSIFTFGDAPYIEVETSFFVLPSVKNAKAMVDRYFEYVASNHRFMHRHTVEKWMGELLDGSWCMTKNLQHNSQRAVVLMVFACSYEYVTDGEMGEDKDMSSYWFQAAKNQLEKETGEIKLTSIQARLLQCMFLLSRSRINQTYCIFGTIVNFIFVRGLHRKHTPQSGDNLIDVECQKRTFWAAYILDKYLSSTLGRPSMFRDEDIDQDLPELVDDKGMSSTSLMRVDEKENCEMKACVYQIGLAQVLSRILKEMYPIHKPPVATRLKLAAGIKEALQQWRESISSFVGIQFSAVNEFYRLQIFALQLTYAHTIVILNRPFLLDNYAQDDSQYSPIVVAQCDNNVDTCLDGAMQVAKLIDLTYNSTRSFKISWFVHYCGYTAIVALYVYVIKRHADPPEIWKKYFEAASECQRQIKCSAESESFATKCSTVLADLQAEALSAIKNNGYTEITNAPSDGNEAQDVPASYFGGKWDDMRFDQSAPGGGILGSLFGTVAGISMHNASGSVVERIDHWGFSSLTGY